MDDDALDVNVEIACRTPHFEEDEFTRSRININVIIFFYVFVKMPGTYTSGLNLTVTILLSGSIKKRA